MSGSGPARVPLSELADDDVAVALARGHLVQRLQVAAGRGRTCLPRVLREQVYGLLDAA